MVFGSVNEVVLVLIKVQTFSYLPRKRRVIRFTCIFFLSA